ncbi:uncharacterized protein LOC107802287 [Nicotiana tabacum]|uniref:uncharacterized protein LOC107802287 n=1 Tax=Nicotiana tabacum TaxID=4097 RepID=UPI003F4ED1D8
MGPANHWRPSHCYLQELYGNEHGDDIIKGFFTNIDDLGMTAKSSHNSPNGSKDHVMGGASSMELIPRRKPYSSSSSHRKLIQLAVTSKVMAATTEVMHPKSFRPSSWPLQPGASRNEPHGTICCAKPTFVFVMWHGLCEWIKEFSVDSTDSFIKLEKSISLTLTEIRRGNIIDISTLEVLVEALFRTYVEYGALRSSKMSKELHQESLSNAQQCLDDTKLEYGKANESAKKLQVALANVETQLASLTSKKKKIIMFPDKHQEKLSKSQKEITVTEGEIYTIEVNIPLSDDEAEKLSLLKVAVKMSLQQFLSFKPFPLALDFSFFSLRILALHRLCRSLKCIYLY